MLAAIMAIAIIGLFAYRTYLKRTTQIISPNGINSLEEITLGGLKQWIFIRSENIRNPVLIFLHGGPGAPLFGMSSARTLDTEIIKHFTVVHWDQRGAGKSYHKKIPSKSMTFDKFVEDCKQLIDHLRSRFYVNKVFLVAHSGGTITGIKTAHKYPEKIHAYVGVCQIIDDSEQQKLSYDFVARESAKAGFSKHIKDVKSLGPPPYTSTTMVNQKDAHIFKYGGVLRSANTKKMALISLNFLTSPEYTLAEGLSTLMNKGFNFTSEAMWSEMRNVKIAKEIKTMKVPIYFFEGKYDMATPTELVENFYNTLEAEEGKKLFIFEESAHLPMIEEKKKYEDLLINVVLKEAGMRN